MRSITIRKTLTVVAIGAFGFALFAIAGSAESEAQRRRRRARDSSKKVADRADRRFDHEAHSQMVKNKLGKDEACAGVCHKMSADLKGWKLEFDDKKEHERCYQGCHGGFKHRYTTSASTLRGMTGRTCFVCHREKLKARPRANNLGKIASKAEITYVATYSHKKHIRESGSGKQCESCHGTWGDETPGRKGALSVGHEYCGTCHAQAAEPPMPNCGGCHKDVSSTEGKNPVVKARKPSVYSVTGAFSHRSHASIGRVSREGKTCMGCHSNVAQGESDTDVPLPTMKGCYESCHDGKKAFSVTGTTCTKCHQGGLK